MDARAIRADDADYSFLIKQCSSAINCCSVDVRFCATRWPHCGPLSGGRRKGITVERSSNRVGAPAPPRPPMLAIGIIGGMADRVPAGAAEMAGVSPTCIAVPAAVTGAAPVQADGTVSGPTEVARPIPAESAGAPEPTAPMPAEPRAPAST